MVDWGDEGILPCHIVGFIDSLCLPHETNVSHGFLSPVAQGLYAIVECSGHDEVNWDAEMSEMFPPITKEKDLYREHKSTGLKGLIQTNRIITTAAIKNNNTKNDSPNKKKKTMARFNGPGRPPKVRAKGMGGSGNNNSSGGGSTNANHGGMTGSTGGGGDVTNVPTGSSNVSAENPSPPDNARV